jgi:hypothetical protein
MTASHSERRSFSPLKNTPGSTLVGFLPVFLLLLLGDFIGISQISPTINYNYLNGSLLFLAAGLLFAFSARMPDGQPYRLDKASWLLAGAGFCIGFDFFIKFSSSVLFFGLAALFLMVRQAGTPILKRLRPVIALGAGYLAGLAAFFLFIYPLNDWLHLFQSSLGTQTGGTHNPFKVINKQIGDIRRIGTNLLMFYTLPLAVVFMLSQKFLSRKPESRWWLILPATLLLNGILAYRIYPITNFRFHSLFYIASLLILLTVHLGMDRRAVFADKRRTFTMLFLFLLPFLLIFGSDASFSYALPLYFLPWFALIFLLIRQFPSRVMQTATLVTLIVLAEWQFVAGYLYYPWRWVENRLAQTERIENIRGLKGIQVDPPTRKFIHETQIIVSQLPPEKRRWMMGWYEMPGVVYWLGGISPGLPWYSHHKQEQMHICKSLQEASTSINLHQALLLEQDETLPKLQPCLNALGITLDRYRSIGQAYNPYSKKPITFYIRKEGAGDGR